MAWVDFVICFLFGGLGVHKFREGKTGMGILYLFTMGIFGIGWFIDSIRYFIAAIKGVRLIPDKSGTSSSSLQITGSSIHDDEALPIVMNSPVILQDDEICHYSRLLPRVTTKNKVVGYSGGSHGVSIRVCKGMSYRIGASRGMPIRQDVVEKNNGTLNITNKRIVFMAAKGSFDKPIAKLSAIEPFQDGISLQFGAQNYFFMSNDGPYIYQIISRIINDNG